MGMKAVRSCETPVTCARPAASFELRSNQLRPALQQLPLQPALSPVIKHYHILSAAVAVVLVVTQLDAALLVLACCWAAFRHGFALIVPLPPLLIAFSA